MSLFLRSQPNTSTGTSNEVEILRGRVSELKSELDEVKEREQAARLEANQYSTLLSKNSERLREVESLLERDRSFSLLIDDFISTTETKQQSSDELEESLNQVLRLAVTLNVELRKLRTKVLIQSQQIEELAERLAEAAVSEKMGGLKLQGLQSSEAGKIIEKRKQEIENVTISKPIQCTDNKSSEKPVAVRILMQGTGKVVDESDFGDIYLKTSDFSGLADDRHIKDNPRSMPSSRGDAPAISDTVSMYGGDRIRSLRYGTQSDNREQLTDNSQIMQVQRTASAGYGSMNVSVGSRPQQQYRAMQGFPPIGRTEECPICSIVFSVNTKAEQEKLDEHIDSHFDND